MLVCGQWGKPEHAYLGKNLSEKNRELINSIHVIPNPQIKFGIQWYNQSTSCGCQLMKVYRALLDNCLNNNHLPLSGWSKAGNIIAYGGFFSVWVSGQGSDKAMKMSSKADTLGQKNRQPHMRGFLLPKSNYRDSNDGANVSPRWNATERSSQITWDLNTLKIDSKFCKMWNSSLPRNTFLQFGHLIS